MKTKELLKRALKNPDLFTEAELKYFRMVQEKRKTAKKESKRQYKEKQHGPPDEPPHAPPPPPRAPPPKITRPTLVPVL